LSDVFMEELIKVNRVDADDHLCCAFRPPISFDALYHLLLPFIAIYVESTQVFQQQYVVKKIFHKLLESMTFDGERREAQLNRPGFDSLDIPWMKKKKKPWFRNRKKKTMIKVNGKMYLPSNQIDNFYDDAMKEVDAHNNVRRRKEQTPIMFDKKNFDVVMPYKEYERNLDDADKAEWSVMYAATKEERLCDPMLLKRKMDSFHKMFAYMAQCEETPRKAKSKLSVLAEMFVLSDGEKYKRLYDGRVLKKALRVVDDRKKQRYWRQKKRFEKKRKARRLNQRNKWRKVMNNKGMKSAPSLKLLKRAAKMIV